MIDSDACEEYENLLPTLSILPAYVADVCEKFVLSMCLVLSIAEKRIPSDDMSSAMKEAIRNPSIVPTFVLVVTWSKLDWVRNVQEAFNIALRKFEKTNRARIIVLTAEQAKSKGLAHEYEPMPPLTSL